MKKDYCTQNDHDCQTCPLSSYGRDCLNNKIIDGGMNEFYNRKADGSLYQCYNAAGDLILSSEIVDNMVTWPPEVAPAKPQARKHGVDGWCDKCQSWCWGDCES